MPTGELAVDHSSAGNIGGVHDVAQRGWSAEMCLAALGIPLAMMPGRLLYSGEVVGRLLEEWAQRLGLQAGHADFGRGGGRGHGIGGQVTRPGVTWR